MKKTGWQRLAAILKPEVEQAAAELHGNTPEPTQIFTSEVLRSGWRHMTLDEYRQQQQARAQIEQRIERQSRIANCLADPQEPWETNLEYERRANNL